MTLIIASLFLPYTIELPDVTAPLPKESLPPVSKSIFPQLISASRGVSPVVSRTHLYTLLSEAGVGTPRSLTPVQRGLVPPRKTLSGIAGMRITRKDTTTAPAAPAEPQFTVTPSTKGNGTLRNSIQLAAQNDLIGPHRWVGTTGVPSDRFPKHTQERIAASLSDYGCAPVFVSDATFSGHYHQFCKQVLWPTLHYQIPDHPSSKAFEAHAWAAYVAVNEAVAAAVVAEYSGDSDLVWVHDYHLLLVPALVRKALPNAKIGFFLHVSFPSSEVFRCLAPRRELLAGILGADSISLQTKEYVRHFLQTCNRLMLADVSSRTVLYDGRLVNVDNVPVGIDVPVLQEQLESSEVAELRQQLRQRYGSRKLIVGRDKFDRLRGLRHKLLAYEKYLMQNPEAIENTVLLQVCLPLFPDEGFETDVMTVVDRINGLSSSFGDVPPVVFIHLDVAFAQYLAMMAEADLFVVASLREGMNLTCHEFVVASADRRAPLVLSEFTGSADVLGEAALSVNPWDTHEMALALDHALNMSQEEKDIRWESAYGVVLSSDSNVWVERCIQSVVDAWVEQQVRGDGHTQLTSEGYREWYDSASSRFFLIDLGAATTVNNASAGFTSVSQNRLLRVLADLTSDPANQVYVLSYDRRRDVERVYLKVQSLGLIAENGAFVRHPNSHWEATSLDSPSWMKSVQPVLALMHERSPGSYLEVGERTMRFHLEKAMRQDPERASAVVGEVIAHVNEMLAGQGVHASCTRDVVTIQPSRMLVGGVLKAYVGADAAFVSGPSSSTFEAVFEKFGDLELQGDIRSVLSVAVGESNGTYARVEVRGYSQLLGLLGGVSR